MTHHHHRLDPRWRALWTLQRAGRIEHVAVGEWRGRGVGMILPR